MPAHLAVETSSSVGNKSSSSSFSIMGCSPITRERGGGRERERKREREGEREKLVTDYFKVVPMQFSAQFTKTTTTNKQTRHSTLQSIHKQRHETRGFLQ